MVAKGGLRVDGDIEVESGMRKGEEKVCWRTLDLVLGFGWTPSQRSVIQTSLAT